MKNSDYQRIPQYTYLDCRDQERVDAPMGKNSFNHRAGPVTDSKAKLAKYLLWHQQVRDTIDFLNDSKTHGNRHLKQKLGTIDLHVYS